MNYEELNKLPIKQRTNHALHPQSGKLSGIYYIYCKSSNKYYIGKTNHLRNRWNQHFNNLAHKKGVNLELQKDYDLYGALDFVFRVVKFHPVPELQEKYWINYFRKQNKALYNS